MFELLTALVCLFGTLTAPLVSVHAEDATNNFTESVSEGNGSVSALKITPVSNRVKLKPGQSLDYAMRITNPSDTGFKFKTYVAPYTVIDEDYNLSFTEERNYTQLSRWIKFLDKDGSVQESATGYIEAGASKTVNYRVTVPEDVPEGGQYATIFIEADNDDIGDSTGIGSVPRLGMIVYGRTDGATNDSAKIVDYKIPGFLTSGPVKASSLVQNEGNTDFIAKYSFKVESITGNELYSDYKEGIVLPETSRRSEFAWSDTGLMGIFKVTYKVEVPGSEPMEETRSVIILPIFMIIIAIILLTAFVFWIIMLIRKRRERKSRLAV